MSNQPQPERFYFYNILKGGRGFYLNGQKFIFKIDSKGGFYDQYGNYYNDEAKPIPDPTNGQPSDDEKSIYSIQSSQQSEEEDEYAEYEPDPLLVQENRLISRNDSHYTSSDHCSEKGGEPEDQENLQEEKKEKGSKDAGQEGTEKKEQKITEAKKLQKSSNPQKVQIGDGKKPEETKNQGAEEEKEENEQIEGLLEIDESESQLSELDLSDTDKDGFQIQYSQKEKRRKEKIAFNFAILKQYPPKTCLRIDYSNMCFYSAPKHIYNMLSKHTSGIRNVLCERDQLKRKTGKGYLILKSRKYAKQLIMNEGVVINGREVYFFVEKYSELKQSPICREELIAEWERRQQNTGMRNHKNK